MRLLPFILLLISNIAQAQDVVKISGHIQEPMSDSVAISYNDNHLAYYPKEYFARVDKKGNFSISFPVPVGVYVQAELKHGIHLAELVLQPGDSLAMTVDTRHFDSTIHYKGRGSAVQNFVAQHTITRGRMNQYTVTVKAEINKAPADFLKGIEKDKQEELDFLQKYKSTLPASFIQYWTAYYQYYNYFFIEQYPQVHEIVRLKRYTDTIPEQNYAVIKAIPYAFNDSLLQLPPYLLYLTGVFDIKLRAAGYGAPSKDTAMARLLQDSVYSLAQKMLPSQSAEYFIAQNLYGRAKGQPLQKTEDQFASFKKRWPASEYLPLLSNQVGMAEKLAPGQPAPDFDIVTADGKTRKLSDLKGKVVYLGFWATWCRQCVGEMITERKMKELIVNKPLEFVYVCLDNDSAAENHIITKYKMTGLFTHAIGGWNSKEVQLYGVQGMPAYFLIDEDGNFAMQNPPSPMQATALILAIEKLFKE